MNVAGGIFYCILNLKAGRCLALSIVCISLAVTASAKANLVLSGRCRRRRCTFSRGDNALLDIAVLTRRTSREGGASAAAFAVGG